MTARGKFNPAWLLAAFLVIVLCTSIGWMAYRYKSSRSERTTGDGDTGTRNTQVSTEVAALPAQVAAQYASDGVELRVQLAAGRAAYAVGNYADAVSALRAVVALSNYDNTTQTAFFLLGNIYDDLGQFADAAFCQRQALRCGQLAAAWHNLALTELHRGDLDAALEAATQAVHLEKHNPDRHMLLAVVYDRRGEYTKALAEAQLSATGDSRSALCLLNLALLTARSPSETIALAAEKILELAQNAPGTIATHRRAAEEYAIWLLDHSEPGNDRSGEAVAALQPALDGSPDDARLLHNFGLLLNRAGKIPEAISVLRRAHTAAPTYAPTLYALADVLASAKNYREAIAATKRGLELDPENTERYFQLALLFNKLNKNENLNDDEPARRTLEQILTIGAPNNLKLSVQVELARLASHRGEHAAALALIRSAAVLAPQDAIVLFNRGVLSWLVDDKTAAYQDLDRALQLQPDHSTFVRTHADLLFRDCRYAEAILAYGKLINITTDRIHGYAQLGWLHQQQRKFSLAENEYRRALNLPTNLQADLSPDQPFTYLLTLNLATVLAESGNRREAMNLLNIVINRYPDHYEAYHNAALFSAALGRMDEAMAFISVAARQAPTAAAVPLARGCLLWGKGLHAEAAAAWEQALTLDPTLTPARYNLDYYRRLPASSNTTVTQEEHR